MVQQNRCFPTSKIHGTKTGHRECTAARWCCCPEWSTRSDNGTAGPHPPYSSGEWWHRGWVQSRMVTKRAKDGALAPGAHQRWSHGWAGTVRQRCLAVGACGMALLVADRGHSPRIGARRGAAAVRWKGGRMRRAARLLLCAHSGKPVNVVDCTQKRELGWEGLTHTVKMAGTRPWPVDGAVHGVVGERNVARRR